MKTHDLNRWITYKCSNFHHNVQCPESILKDKVGEILGLDFQIWDVPVQCVVTFRLGICHWLKSLLTHTHSRSAAQAQARVQQLAELFICESWSFGMFQHVPTIPLLYGLETRFVAIVRGIFFGNLTTPNAPDRSPLTTPSLVFICCYSFVALNGLLDPTWGRRLWSWLAMLPCL